MEANLLAQIANPQLADPRAAFLGSQDANSLAKMRDQRNALALAPGAMSGDKNALAQLAGADPGLAMQIDERGYQRGRDVIQDRRAAAGEGRAAWAFQQAQLSAKTEQIARVLYEADTPQKFEQAKAYLQQQKVDTSQLSFEGRQSYINDAMSLSERIKNAQDIAELSKPMSQAGKLQHDVNNGLITPEAAATAKPAKLTESQRRQKQLYSVAAPEGKTLFGDGTPQNTGLFEALADPDNMRKAMVPGFGIGLGNRLVSPEYQKAKNALETVIATYLYSASGQTANASEIERQAEILTPKWGDDDTTVAAKKARLKTMVESIQMAGETETAPAAGEAPPMSPDDIDALIQQYAP